MTTQHTLPAHPLEASLINMRMTVGAHTVLGKHLSLLAAQLRNSAPAECIALTHDSILQIQRDGGLYVHEHHGAGR